MKAQSIKWIGVSILVLLLSFVLSFLLYIGPMLASILTAIVIANPKYNLNKRITNKGFLLGLGIIGLSLSQVIILEVSKLTLVLNILTYTLCFIGMLMPSKRQSIVG
ncbi:MAG: hypothetical protein Q8Q67_00745 [bacterium]|nr:hypothetical protein [bacterium]